LCRHITKGIMSKKIIIKVELIHGMFHDIHFEGVGKEEIEVRVVDIEQEDM